MRKIFICITWLSFLNSFCLAQNPTQTIRGQVLDARMYKTLPGVHVFLIDKNRETAPLYSMASVNARTFSVGATRCYTRALDVSEHVVMNGVKIHVKVTATWKLDEGDWAWLKLQIKDIKYNFN